MANFVELSQFGVSQRNLGCFWTCEASVFDIKNWPILFFAYEQIFLRYIHAYKCIYEDLQVAFQGPDALRVMIKVLEILWKQVYFSLRLIEIIIFYLKLFFNVQVSALTNLN